jgi:hypothetical protein
VGLKLAGVRSPLSRQLALPTTTTVQHIALLQPVATNMVHDAAAIASALIERAMLFNGREPFYLKASESLPNDGKQRSSFVA